MSADRTNDGLHPVMLDLYAEAGARGRIRRNRLITGGIVGVAVGVGLAALWNRRKPSRAEAALAGDHALVADISRRAEASARGARRVDRDALRDLTHAAAEDIRAVSGIVGARNLARSGPLGRIRTGLDNIETWAREGRTDLIADAVQHVRAHLDEVSPDPRGSDWMGA